MILFTLTMPNINTWNNTWSGVGNIYAKTRPNKLVPNEVVGKSFYYNFGDGWGANVSCRLKGTEKPTNLFCGYNWMIRSIIQNNKIILEK